MPLPFPVALRRSLATARRGCARSRSGRAAGLAVALTVVLGAEAATAYPVPIFCRSGRQGPTCESCHTADGITKAKLELDGPGTVAPGQKDVEYRAVITGGLEHACGFNVSASGGQVYVSDEQPNSDFFDGGFGCPSPEGEVAHDARNASGTYDPDLLQRFDSSTKECVYRFYWTAPMQPGPVTLYGAGVSASLGSRFPDSPCGGADDDGSDCDPVALATRTVTVGVAALPELSCGPSSFAASVVEGGAVTSQSFECENTGSGSLDYVISTNAADPSKPDPWIRVDPPSGSLLGAGATRTHQILYDTSALAPGVHTATVAATSNVGVETIALVLDVVAPGGPASGLECSPGGVSLRVAEGEETPAEFLRCRSTGASLSYAIEEIPSTSWISVEPASAALAAGGAAGHVIRLDTDGLARGRHRLTLRVDPAGPGLPQDVDVEVDVRSARVVAGAGDLLVGDCTNGRILRVDPDTGAVAGFSPRDASRVAGSCPQGVWVDPGTGTVYMTDFASSRLYRVDPSGGRHLVFDETTRVPLDIGYGPRGIVGSPGGDVFVMEAWNGWLWRLEPGTDSLRRTELLAIAERTFGSASWMMDYVDLEGLRGIGIAAGGQGILFHSFGTFGVTPHGGRVRPYGVIRGVRFLPGRTVLFDTIFEGGCGPGGVYETIGDETTELPSGGLLRCPYSFAVTGAGSIYVGDSSQKLGGDARVVLIRPAGGGSYTQEIVASIPDAAGATKPQSMTIVPVDLVPEPGSASLAATAILVLAALGRRRRGGH